MEERKRARFQSECGKRGRAHIGGHLRGSAAFTGLGETALLLLPAAEARCHEGEDEERKSRHQGGVKPTAVWLAGRSQIHARGKQESGHGGERRGGAEQPDEQSEGGAEGEALNGRRSGPLRCERAQSSRGDRQHQDEQKPRLPAQASFALDLLLMLTDGLVHSSIVRRLRAGLAAGRAR